MEKYLFALQEQTTVPCHKAHLCTNAAHLCTNTAHLCTNTAHLYTDTENVAYSLLKRASQRQTMTRISCPLAEAGHKDAFLSKGKQQYTAKTNSSIQQRQVAVYARPPNNRTARMRFYEKRRMPLIRPTSVDVHMRCAEKERQAMSRLPFPALFGCIGFMRTAFFQPALFFTSDRRFQYCPDTAFFDCLLIAFSMLFSFILFLILFSVFFLPCVLLFSVIFQYAAWSSAAYPKYLSTILCISCVFSSISATSRNCVRQRSRLCDGR